MNLLLFTSILAVTAAAPQYSFPQPSPRFPVAQRAPVQTYNAPIQAPRRVAAPVRTYNVPVTTPAPRYTAPIRVAAPVRTYKAPVTTPAPRYTAPRRVATPVRTYKAPVTTPAPRYTAPRRVATPVRTYKAPVTTPAPRYTAPRRVAAPVRTYKAPVTAAPAPAPRYNAPAPAATYNAPTFRIGAPVVPILRDERTMPTGDSGEYKFEFETGNGILRSEQGEDKEKEGYWKFTFPDGTPAVFHYRAGVNGFEVESDLLPVAPPMPAHAIAQIEKARLEDEAFARASASAPGRTYEQPRNTYNYPQ